MQPTVFEAHWWLGFDKKAKNVKWLKKQIDVHLDEYNEDYHNLAALLRMYYEYAPKFKGEIYANELLEKFKNDDYNIDEIQLFKKLYDVDSYINIDEADRENLEFNTDVLLEKLRSKDHSVIVEAIQASRYYGQMNLLSDEVFDAIIDIGSDSKWNESKSAAYHFLVYFSYMTEFDPNEQGTGKLERITVTSSLGANLTQYLIRYPYSSTWKFYAKGISAIKSSGYVSDKSELEYFFINMNTYKKADFSKKVKFIKRLNVYENSSVSFKINAANELLDCHPKVAVPMLKNAYKSANFIIKSTLHARYPELFEYDEKYWNVILLESDLNTQALIKHNLARMINKIDDNKKPADWYDKWKKQQCN
jgi:hypothetical protein